MGLMQLMPSTAREYNVGNPYEPKANIEAGIQHLKSLIDQFGVVELALAAYNAGEGAVAKFNGHSSVPRDAELRRADPLARRLPVAHARQYLSPSDRPPICLTSEGRPLRYRRPVV